MRSATVVLPVPGLPVKLICRLGACAARPRLVRSLSITNSAAMSRMRALTGASPMRSRSSSSMTASAWLCASTSCTVRAAGAAASGGGAGTAAWAVTVPGMEYNGEPIASGHLARRRHAAQLVAHGVDHRLIVSAAEHGAAGDEGVGSSCGHARNVLHLDAAIDLETDVASARGDELPGALDLAQRRVDEALAAKARVDAHDEHQVDLVDHVLEHLQRSRRIEGEARLAVLRADQLQRAIDMA